MFLLEQSKAFVFFKYIFYVLGDDGPSILIEEKVTIRPKARRNSSNRNSYISNRLSVVSTESEGKKSSESVEVLGSLSCTTSPDTDLPSISASSSMGLPASSSYTDSVEVKLIKYKTQQNQGYFSQLEAH